MKTRKREAGFTLLEIMVALAVGGIALGSIYAIGSASTRHFREQGRISSTQTSLRAAMDQLKRDFQRAGFLGTPNVQSAGEACGLPGLPIDDTSGSADTGRLAAISAFNKTVGRPTALDPAAMNNWATVDAVTLTGNYATSGEYTGITISSDGLTVTIPNNWQSYQRDFSEWSGANAGQCNTLAFAAAFPPGRLVRIHTLTDRSFFATVQSASCAGPVTVTISPRIPPACNANGGWISPVNTLRYRVLNAATEEVSRVGANQVAVLRRTEVQPGSKGLPLALAGGASVDDRTIADYVVVFNVDFLIAAGAPNRVSFVPAPEASVRLAPQQVRGAIIELAVRTPEHEPNFFNVTQGLAFPLRAQAGAARVRRLRAEVLLPNIAARGLM